MSGNKNLHDAMKAKQDEFYTQKADIERELVHYKAHFKDKIVYCNCDDPKDGPNASEFWQFFVRNFNDWQLKKLIATHYEPDETTFSYKIETGPDDNGQFSMFNYTAKKRAIKSNGDFRSQPCVNLLKQADIVVTNPPFSLFREYVAQLMKYNKKFVIIGNQNAITYKEIFPLIKDNKIWLGYHSGHTWFGTPDGYKIPERYLTVDKDKMRSNGYMIDASGKIWRNLGNICWFTNLDINKRHEPIDLRGHYSYYENPERYPKYDNYDAIEVSKVDDIPYDYDGVMGVPITFMDKYCPEQFEIVGMTSGRNEFDKSAWPIKRYENALQHNQDGSTTGGSKANTRATILLKDAPRGIYYTADNADGPLQIVYARILIRRRGGEK